jgi:hypothetical protein
MGGVSEVQFSQVVPKSANFSLWGIPWIFLCENYSPAASSLLLLPSPWA